MVAENFPLTSAQLLGNFCETLFYGMYLVTCCFCASTLLLTGAGTEERWLRPHELRWTMISVALVLFIICTFDVAIGLLQNFHAFVKSADHLGELLLDTWISTARSVNQVLVIVIVDLVLVYRCWIVYGRQWLVILPSLVLFLGVVAIAIGIAESVAAGMHPGVLWVVLIGITAVQNMLTTSILIWRIWRVEKQKEKYLDRSELHQHHHLRKVIRVIAESGGTYSLMAVICTILDAVGSNALYPFFNMMLQGGAIAFNFIIFRSSAHRDSEFLGFEHSGRTTLESIRFAHGQSTLGTMEESVVAAAQS